MGGENNSLLNSEDRIFSYDSLIRSLKGSIIYIDVWASWCAPCRAEMPSSATLRGKYKNDNIRFVYISIDDNIQQWKIANVEVGLHKITDSYLLLNAEKSALVKKLQIRSIPRYILINKNGQIENQDAPRPSSDQIIKLFDSMIQN